MKKLLFCTALLAVTASVASAGIAINYTACVNEAVPGTGDRVSTCYVCPLLVDFYICTSFKSPVTRADYLGNTGVIDISFSGGSVPDWWNLDGCRTTAGIALTDATGEARAVTQCPGGDPLAGGSLNSFVFSHVNGFRGANTIRWKPVAVRAFSEPVGITLDAKYYLSVFKVKYGIKTVVDCDATPDPDPSVVCAGCLSGGCFVFNQSDYTFTGTGGASVVSDSSPYAVGGRQFITWQGGTGVGCFAATPAKNATWGSIKALYR